MADDEQREPTPQEIEKKLDELVRMGHDQVDFTKWLSRKVDEIHDRVARSPNPILPRIDERRNGDAR